MRFLKRIAGFLGFVKDEGHEVRDEDEDDVDADVNRQDTYRPRKGFSVPVQVPVERPQVGPVLVPCTGGAGGVQVSPSNFYLFSLVLSNFLLFCFN